MPLSPSRRDTIGPPPRNVSDIAAQVRHQGSYLRSLDPGIQDGRFATPKPTAPGPPRQLVGGDAGGGDDTDYAWEYDDRATITALGTQTPRLSHIPVDETLHVFWHPGGHGGKRLTSEYFTVDDQTVTIPDPGSIWAIGDTFSFQYEYEVTDDVLDFEFIAGVTGVFHGTDNTMTFTPPAAMQPGDFLLIAIRGAVAPGGGDITLGASSGDSRVSVLYAATPQPRETVMTGFATGSTADVVTNIIPDPSYSPSARGVMMVFRGVNGVGSFTAVETGGSGRTGATPQIVGTGTLAVTWDGNASFSLLTAGPPTSYTEAGNTGSDYGATDVSYWFDPAGEISPSGTFVGEGCLVIGLT